MSYESKRAIEAQGFVVLRPYLVEQSGGRLVITSKGTLARWLQESVGDVLMQDANDTLWAIELKTERHHTGNLFLETWSNKNLNKRASHAERGSNPGWLFKLRADLLLYYFLDADILYSIDLFSLKRWAFGYGVNGDVKDGQLYRWSEKRVEDDQLNDTWGRVVPLQALRDELPHRALQQTSIVQRALLNE